jgi:broad specificity phosphatase PhoE
MAYFKNFTKQFTKIINEGHQLTKKIGSVIVDNVVTPQQTATITKSNDKYEIPDNIVIDWVRHAESCSNIGGYIDYIDEKEAKELDAKPGYISPKIMHPPLSPLGIMQAIALGESFFNTSEENYNIYYTSPSIRTIMTAILSLREKHQSEPITLIVTPYISEQLNFGKYFNADNQNSLPTPANLTLMIQNIKDWFQNIYLTIFIDTHLYNKLNEIYNKLNKIIADIVTDKQTSSIQTNISSLKTIIDKINNLKEDTNNKVIQLVERLDTAEYTESNNDDDGVVISTDLIKTIPESITLCETIFNDIVAAFSSIYNLPPNWLITYKKPSTPFSLHIKDNHQQGKKEEIKEEKKEEKIDNIKENIFDTSIEIALLKSILNANFLRGPTVDLSYYIKEYKSIQEKNLKISKEYYQKFFDDIKKHSTTSPTRIVVFSHGGTIAKILSLATHPNNTSVYRVTNNIPEIAYCPAGTLLHQTHTCTKGKEITDGTFKSSLNNCKDNINMLNLFVNTNDAFKTTIIPDVEPTIYNKYLKYKNKYISLKKKLNIQNIL